MSHSDPAVESLALIREDFTPTKARILAAGSFVVDAWRNHNGIEMISISNSVGHILVLPFTGQQVWDATFYGRRLTMLSQVEQPIRTTDYLANNGAYLVHCGGSAMGNPSAADTHPLHGELPNLDLDSARIEWQPATNDSADLLTVHGERHYVNGSKFSVSLQLRLDGDSGVMHSGVQLIQRGAGANPLMYLAHVNFRPAIGGGYLEERLCPEAKVVTRGSRAAKVLPVGELLAPGQVVDPELVQLLPLLADPDTGWKRVIQHHADGSRDIVEHRDPLTTTVRWLHRTSVVEAFAFAIPATAGSDGFVTEQRRGNVTNFPAGSGITASFRHGALAPIKPDNRRGSS